MISSNPSLQSSPCPNCRSGASSFWAAENGFTAVKCAECALVYVNPRPGDEAITEANKVGMHHGEDELLNVRARRDPAKAAHYRRIIEAMFADEIVSGGQLRWLDIGAGYGEFLEAVQTAFHGKVEVLGIEPMEPKAREARQLGLPVSSASLKEVDGRFDIISLINVYSHIPDFDEFALLFKPLLKPRGFLFLETGNLADLDSRSEFPDILYLPDHLVFSGVRQMRQSLERIGFEVVAVEQRSIDDVQWSAKAMLKALLRGSPMVHIPGSSKFRTIFYKAKAR